MRRREIYILSAILAGILALGFTIKVGSFADNVLASAADLIVGIFIALYLVDRISRREKARKWARVKLLTYRSIESVCDLIMFVFQGEAGIAWDADPYKPKAAEAPKQKPQYEGFLELSEEIARRADELPHMNPIVVDPRIRDSHLSDSYSVAEMRDGITVASDEQLAEQLREEQLHIISSQQLLSGVRPHFEKLSLNIFPRVLELDDQEDLFSAFINAESAFRDWESTVDTIEGDWGMPEEYAWKAVAQFCGRIGEMLKLIYQAGRGSDQAQK